MRLSTTCSSLLFFQKIFSLCFINLHTSQASILTFTENENKVDWSNSQLDEKTSKRNGHQIIQEARNYKAYENTIRTPSSSLRGKGSDKRLLQKSSKLVTKKGKSEKASKTSKAKKSSENSKDGSCNEMVETEAVRASLKAYVDSLSNEMELSRGYHPDARDQDLTYNTCTIVQQCLDPDFILSLGKMNPRSRGLSYTAVSKVMSQESFNMLQLQQSSNMLLGEMQDWGTVCEGHCRELRDPNGLLERIVDVTLEEQSDPVPFLSYAQCGQLSSTKKTLWLCNEDPKMVHQANIDTATGKYGLGNIWNEPHIHGRNSWYDYFAAYGDMEEGGGAFGMRFSGHHIDLNYQWDGNGCLINDMPVFLGHNPLIVPDVTPPNTRAHNERINLHDFHPLLWENFAGVTQFQSSVELMLAVTNLLLETASDSYVPLNKWVSNGYYGALDLSDGMSVTDFNFVDLSKVADAEYDIYWELIEYTIKFSRGHRSTEEERNLFREEGKVIWTSSIYPDHIPLTEYDLRSGMNFINMRIETDEWIYFVMSNQMYAVISEDMPSNHFHSIYVPKALISADHACVDDSSKAPGGICYAEPIPIVEEEPEQISGTYKFESEMWDERNLKGRSELNLAVFDEALHNASELNCDLGITATLFNEKAEQIYHKAVGKYYKPMVDGSTFERGYGDRIEGFTGDTLFNPYSNIKGVVASVYLSSVVDSGLGYLDEPIYLTLDYLSEDDEVGKITPRMILSHSSGLKDPDRFDPKVPYYACKYDEQTTLGECLEKHLLLDSNLENPPGSSQSYNNIAFDIIAELAVRKTGFDTFGEIFRHYITEPLGMNTTSYDCAFMRSTDAKPQVAWGTCTTANDFTKWVQMLSNDGVAPSGQRILSKYAIKQMFSHGGGYAVNDAEFIFRNPGFSLTRCVSRVFELEELGIPAGSPLPGLMPYGSLTGYGLGTMFANSNYGHLRFHAGSIGGMWFISPGKYSGYVAWSESQYAYTAVVDAFLKFEDASKFEVAKANVFGETWEEIELCGGHDLYIDYFEKAGIKSFSELIPPRQCDGKARRTSEINEPQIDSYREFFAKQSDRLQKIL